MILIGRSANRINGITIFPDHADAAQFWYLSGDVHLSKRENRSVFTLIKYNANVKAKLAGGGYTMFEVNIGLPPDVEEKIRNSGKLPNDAKLSPVPFNSGTVKCLALDLGQSQILGAAAPTLSGDNTAVFSLKLNETQTALLEQAFSQAGQPIGVVYELEYTAMTPALDVELTANLDKVYDEFQSSFGFKGIVPVTPVFALDVSLETGLQKLIQNGAIVMKVNTFIDNADVQAQKDAALRLFMEQLLKEWFEPTLELPKVTDKDDKDDMALTGSTPAKPNESSASQAKPAGDAANPTDAEKPDDNNEGTGAGEVVEDIVDAGEDLVPTATVKLRYVRQEEKKTVSYRYNGAQTVTRKHYPQGFFNRLLSEVDKGIGMITVDLDDAFFRTIKIDVEAPQLNYEKYGLQSVHFAAKYPDREPLSCVFTKSNTSNQSAEFAVNKKLDTDYEYQVQYNFLPDTDWDSERMDYTVPWQKTDDRTQVLMPHKHLKFLDIAVTLETGFYWEKIQEVQVQLSYQSTDGGWNRKKLLRFTSGSPTEQHWKLRLNSPDADTHYSYQIVYRLEDGSTKSSDPITTDVPAVAVQDLTKSKLVVRVVPRLNAKIDQQVFLDATYTDTDNNYVWEKSLVLNAGQATPQDLQIPLMDSGKTEFEYKLTYLRVNGDAYEKSFPKAKYHPQILVQSVETAAQDIEVSPDGIDWDLISRAVIELRYVDAANNIDKTQSYTFSSGAAASKWRLPQANANLKNYQWRVTYYTNDRKIGDAGVVRIPAAADAWQSSSDAVLMLSAYQPDIPKKPRVQAGKMEVEVVADSLDWNAVRRVVVDLQYEDPKNSLRKADRKAFQDGDSSYIWQVPVKDDRLTSYQWKGTFYMKDTKVGDRGKILYPSNGSWETTDEAVLFLDTFQKTASWIAFSLVDEDGNPLANEPYKLVLPDGKNLEGQLDATGRARIEGIVADNCTITFPRLDASEWSRV